MKTPLTVKEEIRGLQIAVAILEDKILKLAGYSTDGKKPYFSVVSDFWECPKSPSGLCCYDHYNDPVHDNCVFCGDPEERK